MSVYLCHEKGREQYINTDEKIINENIWQIKKLNCLEPVIIMNQYIRFVII